MDEIIDKSSDNKSSSKMNISRGRGRGRAGGRGRGRTTRGAIPRGRPAAGKSTRRPRVQKDSNVVYVEKLQHGYRHLSLPVEEIAKADEKDRTLKVSGETDVKRLAGSIGVILRECGSPPTLLAGGPGAVNQGIKAVAILRSVLAREGDGLDLAAQVIFDGQTPRSTILLSAVDPYASETSDDDLLVKPASDPYKVAGAIAGRLRETGQVGVQAVGPDSVFKAVESTAIARRYLKQDKLDMIFSPSFTTAEDERQTTGIHLAITTTA